MTEDVTIESTLESTLDSDKENDLSNDIENDQSENSERESKRPIIKTKSSKKRKSIQDVVLPGPTELGLNEDFSTNNNDDEIQEEKIPQPSEKEEEKEKNVDKNSKYSEVEQKAIEKGWRPKDEFQGAPEEWRPAKEYLDRGELLDEIIKSHKTNKSIAKENEEIKLAMKTIAEKFNNFERRNVEDTYQKLIEGRKQAFEMGDAESFDKIEKKMNELAPLINEIQEVPAASMPKLKEDDQKVVDEFILENPWLNNKDNPVHMAMTEFVVKFENDLVKYFPDVKVRIEKTREALKEKFPNYIDEIGGKKNVDEENRVEKEKKSQQEVKEREKPVQQNYQTVSSGQSVNRPSKKTGLLFDDMPSDIKVMIKTMLRANPKSKLTPDGYVKQLIEMGYIDPSDYK